MADATLPDGTKQPLYFPPGHKKAGLFKGMEVILQEQGFHAESQLKAQCNKKFDCPNKGQMNCCCHQTLYNQPDFFQVDSLLESYCQLYGVEILFLPNSTVSSTSSSSVGASQNRSIGIIQHLQKKLILNRTRFQLSSQSLWIVCAS
jgi:hypothetical protein